MRMREGNEAQKVVDDIIYTSEKKKGNTINWLKEETPEQMASTSWMITLIYNINKHLILKPEDIRVAELKVPYEDWFSAYEDWVADMMEKYGSDLSDDPNDPLKATYEDLIRHYTFDAVMKAFPNGFDYKITEDMSDIALEKVKKVLGTWKTHKPIEGF